MSELFHSGHAIDIVLVVVALELAGLLLLWRRRREGLSPRDLLGLLAPGALLMLALRCALTGVDYRLTALLVTASFPVHLYDLIRRRRAADLLAAAK
jgi:hypothetical protein